MILSDLGKLVFGFGVNGSDFGLYRRDVVTLFIFFIVEKVLLIVNRAAVRIRVKCTQMIESTSNCRSGSRKCSWKAPFIDWDDHLSSPKRSIGLSSIAICCSTNSVVGLIVGRTRVF